MYATMVMNKDEKMYILGNFIKVFIIMVGRCSVILSLGKTMIYTIAAHTGVAPRSRSACHNNLILSVQFGDIALQSPIYTLP